MTCVKYLIAGTAMTFGMVLAATPAYAGDVCELNGTDSIANETAGGFALACGSFANATAGAVAVG